MRDSDRMFKRVRDAIGERAAMEMVKGWGSVRLYIPASIYEEHPIAMRIGIDAAKLLIAELGPGHITLPSYNSKIRAKRDQRIRLLARFKTCTEIAREFGLSDRQIRSIVRPKGGSASSITKG